MLPFIFNINEIFEKGQARIFVVVVLGTYLFPLASHYNRYRMLPPLLKGVVAVLTHVTLFAYVIVDKRTTFANYLVF